MPLPNKYFLNKHPTLTRIQKHPPPKKTQFKLYKQKLSSNCTSTEARRPDDHVKTKQKKTFTDNFQEDKIKIKEQEKWLWKKNSVAPEELTVFLYTCDSRFSYLLCAKYYTARNKNSFQSVNFYRIYGNKECFSLCSCTLTSPDIRTRSQAPSKWAGTCSKFSAGSYTSFLTIQVFKIHLIW